MKQEKDYSRDLAEIRSMMERSSKFLSLSGWAGIMAGIYALAGAYIAYAVLGFNPGRTTDPYLPGDGLSARLLNVILLAIFILAMAVGTAIYLSSKKAEKRGEKLWNATARRVVINMAVPLIVGGLLILIMISKGLIGFVAPFTLLFYGLALYNASKFTYGEMRSLGLIEIGLGLIGSYFVGYGLILWAIGFGVVHILYGIYMHYKYEQ
jgi:hypothetical protein